MGFSVRTHRNYAVMAGNRTAVRHERRSARLSVISDDLADSPAAAAALIPRALKEALVRHPLRDRELYPTLIASRGGEAVAMCDLQSCWPTRHNVLRETVAILAPDEVVLAVETFAALTPNLVTSGDALSERFRGGDATVTKAIEVLRMTRSGEGERVCHPYSYSGDNVAWREPREPTIELDRDVPDSLVAGFAAAGEPRDPDDARAALKAFGARVRFFADPNPFDSVVPGDPCACGSKRKYEDCHGY